MDHSRASSCELLLLETSCVHLDDASSGMAEDLDVSLNANNSTSRSRPVASRSSSSGTLPEGIGASAEPRATTSQPQQQQQQHAGAASSLFASAAPLFPGQPPQIDVKTFENIISRQASAPAGGTANTAQQRNTFSFPQSSSNALAAQQRAYTEAWFGPASFGRGSTSPAPGSAVFNSSTGNVDMSSSSPFLLSPSAQPGPPRSASAAQQQQVSADRSTSQHDSQHLLQSAMTRTTSPPSAEGSALASGSATGSHGSTLATNALLLQHLAHLSVEQQQMLVNAGLVDPSALPAAAELRQQHPSPPSSSQNLAASNGEHASLDAAEALWQQAMANGADDQTLLALAAQLGLITTDSAGQVVLTREQQQQHTAAATFSQQRGTQGGNSSSNNNNNANITSPSTARSSMPGMPSASPTSGNGAPSNTTSGPLARLDSSQQPQQQQQPSLVALLSNMQAAGTLGQLLANLGALASGGAGGQGNNGKEGQASGGGRQSGGGSKHAGSPGPSKQHTLYKTELCRGWLESGTCRYGAKCQFAHGREELRPVPRHPKYKTEVCRSFAATGVCAYGPRCRFIHSTASSASHNALLTASSGHTGDSNPSSSSLLVNLSAAAAAAAVAAAATNNTAGRPSHSSAMNTSGPLAGLPDGLDGVLGFDEAMAAVGAAAAADPSSAGMASKPQLLAAFAHLGLRQAAANIAQQQQHDASHVTAMTQLMAARLLSAGASGAGGAHIPPHPLPGGPGQIAATTSNRMSLDSALSLGHGAAAPGGNHNNGASLHTNTSNTTNNTMSAPPLSSAASRGRSSSVAQSDNYQQQQHRLSEQQQRLSFESSRLTGGNNNHSAFGAHAYGGGGLSSSQQMLYGAGGNHMVAAAAAAAAAGAGRMSMESCMSQGDMASMNDSRMSAELAQALENMEQHHHQLQLQHNMLLMGVAGLNQQQQRTGGLFSPPSGRSSMGAADPAGALLQHLHGFLGGGPGNNTNNNNAPSSFNGGHLPAVSSPSLSAPLLMTMPGIPEGRAMVHHQPLPLPQPTASPAAALLPSDPWGSTGAGSAGTPPLPAGSAGGPQPSPGSGSRQPPQQQQDHDSAGSPAPQQQGGGTWWEQRLATQRQQLSDPQQHLSAYKSRLYAMAPAAGTNAAYNKQSNGANANAVAGVNKAGGSSGGGMPQASPRMSVPGLVTPEQSENSLDRLSDMQLHLLGNNGAR